MKIYLDNAASAPMLPEVLDEMIPYLRDFYGNPSSVHAHGRQLRSAIETARKKMADILGCSPGEIIFTGGGTEADNMAIKCSVETGKIKHLISSKIEHHAVGHSLETALKHHPYLSLSYLSVDNQGNIDHSELESLLKSNEKGSTFVSLMHGNNEIGTLNDVEKIAEICTEYGAVFHSDTVQTMGHIPFNIKNIDFFVGSAHKFYGPKGVGFLYQKPGTIIPSLLCGGGQERNRRAGTENLAGIVGMAKAFEIVHQRHEELNKHLTGLKEYFIGRLRETISGIKFNGVTDTGKSLPTVVNVTFPGEEELLMLMNLDIRQISASGGSACSSGSVHASHVLHEIGLAPTEAINSVRFSFGFQNTKAELNRVIDVLAEILQVKSPVVSS